MITSPHNPKIQLIRSLLNKRSERDGKSLFVAEGVRLVEEAVNSPYKIESVVYSEALSERGRKLLPLLAQKGIAVDEVPAGILDSISDTENSQGILAVIHQGDFAEPSALNFILIIDEMRDPGNLGTIFRTAAAAGVQFILLTKGTVDPYSPKVVRSAMGAHFHLHLAGRNWQQISAFCSKYNLPVIVSDAGRGNPA